MKLAAAFLVVGSLCFAACSRPHAGRGLPSDALDAAIGPAIGDPTTCVLLADPTSGKVVYRYGEQFNCERALPACDRAGTLSARTALAFAATPGGREASCPSSADGSRTVGWAQGRSKSRMGALLYSAVMEGDRALPGHEIAARLAGAFGRAGL